jgi:hypothetical protein
MVTAPLKAYVSTQLGVSHATVPMDILVMDWLVALAVQMSMNVS